MITDHIDDRKSPDGFVLDEDGFAVPWSDIQLDWLVEHGDDPDEGPPESWPEWTDGVVYELVPAFQIEESLFRPECVTTRWQRWLATAAVPVD